MTRFVFGCAIFFGLSAMLAAQEEKAVLIERGEAIGFHLDVGGTFKQDTTESVDLSVGASAERKKGPGRLTLQTHYMFVREKQQDGSSSTTDNDIRGLVKWQYKFSKRVLYYASHDLDYDENDELSLGWGAKGGPG